MKLLGLLVLVLTSCQQSYRENNPYTYHKKDQKFFQKYVNQESLPEKVDLQKVRALHNPAYPIEVALFNDAKFYYYLENLGDGKGSWKYEDGSLYLYAERLMFVMEMEIHSVEESGEEIIIDFEDRHGPKWLPLDKRI